MDMLKEIQMLSLIILGFLSFIILTPYNSIADNTAIYFPAEEVSTETHIYWYSMVSLADPRINPSGCDFSDSSITVEAWIKPEKTRGVIVAGGNISARKTSDGFVLYLWKGASPYPQEGCHDYAEFSCVKFAIKSNGKWYAATAHIPEDLTGEWHHVAGVYDAKAGKITVYVDGIALHGGDRNHPNGVTGVPPMREAGPTFIGANQTFVPEAAIGYAHKGVEIIPKPVHWFKGIIDEVRLWREARSAAQLQICKDRELEESGECRIKETLATYLTFNEGAGSTVHDMSGHGNNGSSRYYQKAKTIKKDHAIRIGYHMQVKDPESLEIMDPANWVSGFPAREY